MKKLIRRPWFRLAIRTVLALVLSVPLTFVATHAQVRPFGQLIVLDQLGGPELSGAIYLVDIESGQRTILSSFDNTAQGDRLFTANNVAVGPRGFIYITSGKLILRVNPLTGNRTTVTDLADPDQGPIYDDSPEGLAIASDRTIYATAPAAGIVFSVDPLTGVRSTVADLNDPLDGPVPLRPERILLESSEATMLILDRGQNRILRLELSTGLRELVSSFDDASEGVTASNLFDFALEGSGNIVVTSFSGNLLIRVDADDGKRSEVSDFDNLEQGKAGRSLEGVTVDELGRIFVVDSSAGGEILANGVVFQVDPDNGDRTIATNFGDDTEGPTGFKPTAVALAIQVTPTPELVKLVRTVLVATAGLQLKSSARVISGNVITNNDSASAKVAVDKGATTPAGFEVAAEVVTIGKRAVVGGDVVWGEQLNNQGTIEGTEIESMDSFPPFEGLPPFNKPITGDAKIVVRKFGFLTLPPGRFKKITVKNNGVLVLPGGVYEAESFSTGKNAEVVYEGRTEIRLSQQAKFGKGSVFHPASDTLLDAKAAVLYTAAFKAGKGTVIHANIVAPNAIVKFGTAAALTGSAYGRSIVLGKSARVTLKHFLEDSIINPD
jgi:hypothetical protein